MSVCLQQSKQKYKKLVWNIRMREMETKNLDTVNFLIKIYESFNSFYYQLDFAVKDVMYTIKCLTEYRLIK